MLTYSFCLLGGLSLDAEQRLWRHGVISWADYCRRGAEFFRSARHQRVLADIPAAEAALRHRDVRFFLEHLPLAAQVRVWPLLADRAVYLDIETTGLDDDDQVTTAALYDGRSVRTFVRDQDLHELPAALPPSSVLVTYNGQRFDLPRLRRQLGCTFPQRHLDLSPALRKAGLGPGLKACERQLGVTRKETAELTGADAVRLWAAYQSGHLQSLKQLLAYNLQDVLVLERLLVAACNRSMGSCPLYRAIPSPIQPGPEQLR